MYALQHPRTRTVHTNRICERARLKWALSPKNVKLSFHHQQPRVGMEIHFAAKIS